MRTGVTSYFSNEELFVLSSLDELSAITCYLMRNKSDKAGNFARALAHVAFQLPQDLFDRAAKNCKVQNFLCWNETWAVKSRDNSAKECIKI